MVELAMIPAAVRVNPQGEDEILMADDSCAVKSGEVVDPTNEVVVIDLDDMDEAVGLLQRARIIMSCLADQELTPKIMKVHRETLDRLVAKIEKFLEYVDEEDKA